MESRPRITKGFHLAREALAPDRCFLVGTGPDRYPVTAAFEAIGRQEPTVALRVPGAPASARRSHRDGTA